jgi:hypothetical protein
MDSDQQVMPLHQEDLPHPCTHGEWEAQVPSAAGTREDLYTFHRDMTSKALATMVAKNQDYASEEDPFANFRLCEVVGLCSTPAGVLVRLFDKLRRLSTFEALGEFAVSDEKVEDTVEDAINYLIIYAYLRGSCQHYE